MGDIIALRSADAKTPPEGGVSTSNRCEQHGKCVSLSFLLVSLNVLASIRFSSALNAKNSSEAIQPS